MPISANKWKRPLLHLLALLLLLVQGCSGGCGGCTGTAGYTFPQDKVINGVFKTVVTKSGVQFLERNLKKMMQGALANLPGFSVTPGGRIKYTLPKTADCNGNGTPESNFCLAKYTWEFLGFDVVDFRLGLRGAELTLDFSSLKIEFVDASPPKIRITVNDAEIGFSGYLYSYFEVFGFGGDVLCLIDNGIAQGSPTEHMFKASMTLELTLAVDAQGNFQSSMTIPALDIQGLDMVIRAPRQHLGDRPEYLMECMDDCHGNYPDDCEDDEDDNECHWACDDILHNIAGVLTGLRNFFDGILDSLFRRILPPIIQSAILDRLNGQPLKIEGQLQLSDLLGDALPLEYLKHMTPIGFSFSPAAEGIITTSDGQGVNSLQLTFNAGTEAAPTTCAPQALTGNYHVGPEPLFTGLDSNGEAYHFAAALSEAFVKQTLHTVYNSGALCAKITSEDIFNLAGGAFSLSTTVLGFMVDGLWEVSGKDRPIMLALNPHDPPVLTFGSGNTAGETPDSLFKLKMENMGISFYAPIGDRFARLFQVVGTLDIGLSIFPQPDNSLQITLDALKISKITERYNEIFTSADLAQVLDLLIGMATDVFLGSNFSINLNPTEIMAGVLGPGIGLKINEMRRDGVERDWLSIFLTLTEEASAPMEAAVETEAAPDPDLPLLMKDQSGRNVPRGKLGLLVSGTVGAGELEYQAKVDFGAWRPFRPGTRIVAESPFLKLPGWHTILVRARTRSDYRTLDPTPKKLKVLVDYFPPELLLKQEGGRLLFEATDDFTEPDMIRFAVRVDDGLTSPFTRERDFALNSLSPGRHTLTVTAQDESGNETRQRLTLTVDGDGNVDGHPLPGCACRSTGTGGGLGFLLCFLLLGLALFRSKRAR